MIDKEKFKEFMLSQLGETEKLMLKGEEPETSRRATSASRIEDIVMRMLHQAVANQVQILAQVNGVPIARPEHEKNNSSAGGNITNFDFNKIPKGSIIEGQGREGYKPLFMADLGMYGWDHPRSMACKNPRGMQEPARRSEKITLQCPGDYEVSQLPVFGQPPPTWESSIAFFPSSDVRLDDDDIEEFNKSVSFGEDPQFRVRLKSQPNSSGITVTFVTYFEALRMLKSLPLLLPSEKGQIQDAWDSICYGDGLNSSTFNNGGFIRVTGSGQFSFDYESGLHSFATAHVDADYSGQFSDESYSIIEARMFPGVGRSLPVSRVLPGQGSTIPRVSPATVNRPSPPIFQFPLEMGKAQTATEDLKNFRDQMVRQMEQTNNSLLSQVATETATKLKKDLDKKTKLSVSCAGVTSAILEGFLFKTSITDRIQKKCWDTNDNAKRKRTKKTSLKNK